MIRIRNLDGAITDYTYQIGTNKLSQTSGADPASYTYDATGRMTDRDGTDLIWDERGCLTSAEINGQSQGAYDYDNQNRRVIRTAGGETLHTVYDRAGNVLTEINDQGELLREFAYLDGVCTALFDYTGTTPATYYYLSDHLNTAQLLTDASGLVAWQGN